MSDKAQQTGFVRGATLDAGVRTLQLNVTFQAQHSATHHHVFVFRKRHVGILTGDFVSLCQQLDLRTDLKLSFKFAPRRSFSSCTRRRIVTVIIHSYYPFIRVICLQHVFFLRRDSLATTQKRQIELKPPNCISVLPSRWACQNILRANTLNAHVLHFIRSLFRDM